MSRTPGFPESQAAARGCERVLRIGIIGAGRIGTRHGHVLFGAGFAELAAVCDTERGAAGRLATTLGVKAWGDPLELIRSGAIDAVDICTPPDTHAPLAVAAAEAGLHVLVQKPLGLSLRQARRVIDAARRHGVVLMVAMSHRFCPRHRAVRAAIRAGHIGRPMRMKLSWRLDVTGAPPGHWIYDRRRSGGGVMMGLMLQQIDLVSWLAGAVCHVKSAEARHTDARFAPRMEDFARAALELADGVRADLEAIYGGGAPPVEQLLEIHGTHGTLRMAQDGPIELLMADGAAAVLPPDRGVVSKDRFANELAHFAACCNHAAQPECSGEDHLQIMRTLVQLRWVARGGRAAHAATNALPP